MKLKHSAELYRMKAEISKTFADPKRLIIIDELRDGEKTVSELVESTGIPQAVLSRQLGILREHGIARPRRDGNRVYYSITDMRICEACDIVQAVLMDRLSNNLEHTNRLLE